MAYNKENSMEISRIRNLYTKVLVKLVDLNGRIKTKKDIMLASLKNKETSKYYDEAFNLRDLKCKVWSLSKRARKYEENLEQLQERNNEGNDLSQQYESQEKEFKGNENMQIIPESSQARFCQKSQQIQSPAFQAHWNTFDSDKENEIEMFFQSTEMGRFLRSQQLEFQEIGTGNNIPTCEDSAQNGTLFCDLKEYSQTSFHQIPLEIHSQYLQPIGDAHESDMEMFFQSSEMGRFLMHQQEEFQKFETGNNIPTGGYSAENEALFCDLKEYSQAGFHQTPLETQSQYLPSLGDAHESDIEREMEMFFQSTEMGRFLRSQVLEFQEFEIDNNTALG